MINVKVDLSNFKRLIDQNNAEELKKRVILNNTLLLEEFCKQECPVDTGRMQSSISSQIDSDCGTVTAHVDYAKYVIEGTSKQAPNNFNARAVMTLKSQGIEL